MKGAIAELLKPLFQLYQATGVDWDLTVTHCLTEPTCPIVVIRPEGSDMMRYAAYADSIEEGVRQVVDRVKREVLEGEVVGHGAPFTNPDDRPVEAALRRGLSPAEAIKEMLGARDTKEE